jgi:protein-tyrosine kinase
MENIMNKPAEHGVYYIDPPAPEPRRRARMGVILIEAGRLKPVQAERISDTQHTFGLPYGECGVKLGILQPEDVRYALSVQFGFPQGKKPGDKVSPTLVAAIAPAHPAVEAIKALRTQLVLGWLDGHDCNTLSIVSAERGDGRSFIAANLAIVFSQLRRRTLLIDMDMRNPTLHRWFGIRNASGLSDILAERDSSSAIQPVDFCENLSLLTSGPTPPNPQELLSGDGLGALLDRVRGEYDVVIADTPTSDAGADAQLIAAHTRSAVVVSRLNHTMTRATRTLVQRLKGGGVSVLGVVATEH